MQIFSDAAGLLAAKGQALGSSEWLTVEQSRVDAFADVTNDHQWIHVDVDRAKAEGPFGTTVAHGFLTLSLIPTLLGELIGVDTTSTLNYGLDKVRFVSPVRTGSRIRAVSEIADVQEVPGGAQVTFRTTVELEGSERPACVAEHITRFLFS